MFRKAPVTGWAYGISFSRLGRMNEERNMSECGLFLSFAACATHSSTPIMLLKMFRSNHMKRARGLDMICGKD